MVREFNSRQENELMKVTRTTLPRSKRRHRSGPATPESSRQIYIDALFSRYIGTEIKAVVRKEYGPANEFVRDDTSTEAAGRAVHAWNFCMLGPNN